MQRCTVRRRASAESGISLRFRKPKSTKMIDKRTRTVQKNGDTQTIDADVCVVGAGAAGLTAALTGASLERHTILLDAMPTLGGQPVGTLLGAICGLYSNGPRPDFGI
jgi:NADPH-dependent 2,4-dienoyl-CoA reductase/sulfur reductase-like enzyme